MQYGLSAITATLAFFLLLAPLSISASAHLDPADIHFRINEGRSADGLPELEQNAALELVARARLANMKRYGYFAHVSPFGKTVSDTAGEYGYRYRLIAENLARGEFSDSRAVVEGWLESPPHRASMLSTAYDEVGVAVGQVEILGSEQTVVVSVFGRQQQERVRSLRAWLPEYFRIQVVPTFLLIAITE